MIFLLTFIYGYVRGIWLLIIYNITTCIVYDESRIILNYRNCIDDGNPFYWQYTYNSTFWNTTYIVIVCTMFVPTTYSIVPKVPCDNIDNVDNDYLIIMMTIKIIVHTQCMYTIPKHFSVVHATTYIFSLFPRFATNRAMLHCGRQRTSFPTIWRLFMKLFRQNSTRV